MLVIVVILSYFVTTLVMVGNGGFMYYDKERDELFSYIEKMNSNALAPFATPSMGENMIVRCLYNIANELHELNTNLRAGVDDGR